MILSTFQLHLYKGIPLNGCLQFYVKNVCCRPAIFREKRLSQIFSWSFIFKDSANSFLLIFITVFNSQYFSSRFTWLMCPFPNWDISLVSTRHVVQRVGMFRGRKISDISNGEGRKPDGGWVIKDFMTPCFP